MRAIAATRQRAADRTCVAVVGVSVVALFAGVDVCVAAVGERLPAALSAATVAILGVSVVALLVGGGAIVSAAVLHADRVDADHTCLAARRSIRSILAGQPIQLNLASGFVAGVRCGP